MNWRVLKGAIVIEGGYVSQQAGEVHQEADQTRCFVPKTGVSASEDHVVDEQE